MPPSALCRTSRSRAALMRSSSTRPAVRATSAKTRHASAPTRLASRSEMFHTVYDRQSEVEIDVYQGESDDVRHNHRVGRFMVQGLAPVPAGNQLVVQLDLDLNGILRVSARERATGLQKQVTIE